MKKALVAIDQSQNSQLLISYAFRFAEKNSIERLDFIHVLTRIDLTIPGYVDYPPHYNEESIRQSFLNMIEKGLRDAGVSATLEFQQRLLNLFSLQALRTKRF